jgi:hypothetical protein
MDRIYKANPELPLKLREVQLSACVHWAKPQGQQRTLKFVGFPHGLSRTEGVVGYPDYGDSVSSCHTNVPLNAGRLPASGSPQSSADRRRTTNSESKLPVLLEKELSVLVCVLVCEKKASTKLSQLRRSEHTEIMSCLSKRERRILYYTRRHVYGLIRLRRKENILYARSRWTDEHTLMMSGVSIS